METIMKKVLFICEGNICRSATAEAYFNYRMAQLGLEDEYHAESRGLIFTTQGQDIHPEMAKLLDNDGITHAPHSAKMANRKDFESVDYVLVMESLQKVLLKRNFFLRDMSKVSRLGDYLEPARDIDDPFGSGKFKECYPIVLEAVDNFIQHITEESIGTM